MADRSSVITRRDFLGASIRLAAVASQLSTSSSSVFGQEQSSFAAPKGFWWGTSAASYQVEGAWKEDGKGESIWDRFAHTPGKIQNGDTGDIASDFYRRYKEDVRLMRGLGLNSHRFSISWPRIQPRGSGKANDRGIDFYKRLIDTLLEAGIRPLPTLYHWDLPQALEEEGGWPKRDTAKRFADYTDIVTRELGDRLQYYLIFNEPWVFTTLGYLLGTHAPGRADLYAFLYATHTVSLAQGMAFRAIKAVQPKALVGSTFSMSAVHSASASVADRRAVERTHLSFNVWFLEAALKGNYPEALVGVAPENLGVKPGDMDVVRAPLDFIMINSYPRTKVSAISASTPENPHIKAPQATENTICLYEIVARITKDYNRPVIEITEKGHDFGEVPDARGVINDQQRIDYCRRSLSDLARSIRDGADVRGYHISSLTDTFEWADGHTKRFGLAYVDFATQKRILKESGRWYAGIAKSNLLHP